MSNMTLEKIMNGFRMGVRKIRNTSPKRVLTITLLSLALGFGPFFQPSLIAQEKKKPTFSLFGPARPSSYEFRGFYNPHNSFNDFCLLGLKKNQRGKTIVVQYQKTSNEIRTEKNLNLALRLFPFGDKWELKGMFGHEFVSDQTKYAVAITYRNRILGNRYTKVRGAVEEAKTTRGHKSARIVSLRTEVVKDLLEFNGLVSRVNDINSSSTRYGAGLTLHAKYNLYGSVNFR